MLYAHIPFCRHKCIYCDFYSVGERLADWPGFIRAILAEARTRVPIERSDDSPRTIYIGGGTPSLIPPSEFRRLADGLLLLMPDPVEFTIEVNPDDVSPEIAALWADCGVNRVSMGVQCLDDEALRMLCRRHDAATAIRAFNTLRENFKNISLDLMFGLPGQTLDSLARTLETFISLRPEHISAYSLMYEERTALTRMRDRGAVKETDEVDTEKMFSLVSDSLADAGYTQYEISNFALPGFESVHNSGYWHGHPYTGLGPAAHSYDGLRTRRANLPDFRAYTLYWNSPAPAPCPPDLTAAETLTDNELREEYIMTRLRTRQGISLDEFQSRFGESALRVLLRDADTLLRSGMLQQSPHRLSISRKAIPVSDSIISQLF